MNWYRYNPDEILEALDNTPMDYREFLLNTRNPGPGSSGSVFLTPQTWESLSNVAWEVYDHPEIQPPAKGYIAPIPGRLGIIELETLDPDTEVVLSDPKGTGFVEAEVPGVLGETVDFSVALVGPAKETGEPTIWTIFPGDPIMPSRIPAEGNPDRHITVSEALDLGLVWGKVAPKRNPLRNPRYRRNRNVREYTFACGQGQHFAVAEVLLDLGMKVCIDPFSHFMRGRYGRSGHLVKAQIPEGVSRSSIDREMKRRGIPGASGKNIVRNYY